MSSAIGVGSPARRTCFRCRCINPVRAKSYDLWRTLSFLHYIRLALCLLAGRALLWRTSRGRRSKNTLVAAHVQQIVAHSWTSQCIAEGHTVFVWQDLVVKSTVYGRRIASALQMFDVHKVFVINSCMIDFRILQKTGGVSDSI